LRACCSGFTCVSFRALRANETAGYVAILLDDFLGITTLLALDDIVITKLLNGLGVRERGFLLFHSVCSVIQNQVSNER